MKTDKAKLLRDIEAMKEKLASMEEELNKPKVFKHFPGYGDIYYFYTSSGAIRSNEASTNSLKVNTYKTREEAEKAYNKAIALEKIKRRLLELQGDWKPNWKVNNYKHIIIHSYNHDRFGADVWERMKYPTLIPFMKTSDIATIIIEEMEDELKVIFDLS